MNERSKKNTQEHSKALLRIDGAIARLERPQDLTCTRCGAPLEPFTLKWPRHDKHVGTIWVNIWPQYTCQACGQALECETVSKADLLTIAGMAGQLRSHTFATFATPSQLLAKARAKAERFFAAPEGNLWIYGGPGTGKTHLACAGLREEIDRDHKPLFAEMTMLMTELRVDFLAVDSPMLPESKWAKASILVLDDLGTEKVTERGLELLTAVVNERSKHHRPIVTTSNHEPDELMEKLSPRLISRLMENYTVIHTGTDDFRCVKRHAA